MILKKFTYKDLLVLSSSCFFCVMLNNVFNVGSFFSLSFYVAGYYLNLNPTCLTLAFIVSFIPTKSISFILASFLTSLIINFVFTLYKKKNKSIKGELIIYSTICSFVFFPLYNQHFIFKLIKCVVCVILTFIFINALKVVYVKQLNYKTQMDENTCVAVLVILIEVGFIRFFGANISRSVNIFIILFATCITKNTKTLLISSVLSVANCILNYNFIYLSSYILLSLTALIFIKSSKLLSSVTTLFVDLALLVVFKTYGEYSTFDVFYSIVPVCLFLFVPNDIINYVSNKLKVLDDKYLTKIAINKIRGSLSYKLYGVSDVFTEIENSFIKLKNQTASTTELIKMMTDEVCANVCYKCINYSRCKIRNYPNKLELEKILQVGIAKSRVLFMDLTKEFSENCNYTNSILYEMNLLIGKYKEKIHSLEDISMGKELVMLQAEGVSNMLKNMAVEYGKTLNVKGEEERKVDKSLKKRGIIAKEILIYNEDNDLNIELIINKEEQNTTTILSCLKEIYNTDLTIVSSFMISSNYLYLSFKTSPKFDASFGLSVVKKDGSLISGDTHSLQKINENKFIVALSDGMGSGIKAENTSSSAISLIESFYKAGLPNKTIINMVNKILAINTTDNFSAMDILTVDLSTKIADFIKIGSPFSFIISDKDIKIIEGSSLPLGILDEAKPIGTNVNLKDGDTVIMFSDGISDAFGSTTDLIEFLKTLQNRNPQVMTDAIIQKAQSMQQKNKDDMTVLAVRIFKKNLDLAS